jgi:diaminopimelate decarboxylase
MACAFQDAWNPLPTRILYSVKANYTPAVWQALAVEGASADCIGLNELRSTLQHRLGESGTVVLNGNLKKRPEIELAVRHGARIVIDHIDEIDVLAQVCTDYRCTAAVGLRVLPDLKEFNKIKSEISGESIRDHVLHTKWGLDHKNACEIIKRCGKSSAVNVVAAHFHLGRQLGTPRLFELMIPGYVRFLDRLHRATGWHPQVINVGGGFTEGRDPYNWKHRRRDVPGLEMRDSPAAIEDYAATITAALRTELESRSMLFPELECESGRFIAGSAACTLTEVSVVKKRGRHTWVSVDVGANQIGLARSPQNAHLVLPVAIADGRPEVFDVVGPLCVPDVVAARVRAVVPEPGSFLAVLDTGAYSDSEASNSNALGRPAVVAVDVEDVRLFRRREAYDDVFARDNVTSSVK